MATVLITGANRGLGLGLTRAYLEDGWNVIAIARQSLPERLAAEHEGLEIHRCDLVDDGDLDRLAGAMAGRVIDVLINNAGRMAKRPGADEAEGLAEELRALQLLLDPAPLGHRVVSRDDVVRDREHEREGELRHGDGRGIRCVDALDALRLGVRDVDVVHSHAAPDDQLQVGRGIDVLLRTLRLAPDQHDFRFRQNASLIPAYLVFRSTYSTRPI